MDFENNTDLIEAFLSGALSEEERLEVEQRMAADLAFRKEVRLHRYLREQLSDPQRWKHYNAMAETRGKPGPQVKNASYWKWLILLAVLVIVGFLIWKLNRQENSTILPSKQVPGVSVPLNADTLLKEKDLNPQAKGPDSQPVAALDPTDFQRNKSMDDLINYGMKNSGWSVFISSPEKDANFKPGKNGKTTVRFSGTVENMAPVTSVEINLLLFNNKDIQNPLAQHSLILISDSAGKASFFYKMTLDFNPGLYYFFMEETENNELLTGSVSSFFIRM